MNLDILIKNGHVIDPAGNVDAVEDIGIYAGKIVDIKGKYVEALQEIDAEGCYVFPGLIDYHTHIFFGGTNLSCCPDYMVSSGVTAAVDAGSVGGYTYPVFAKNVATNSNLHLKAFVSCYPMGLGGEGVFEIFDPKLFDKKFMIGLLEKYGSDILGLKMRISRNLMSDLTPLRESIRFASELGENVPVCVHITDPAGSMDEVMGYMRPKDIICHVYAGTGNTILDENGKILPSVLAARERGVLFDVANGKMNFSIDVCRKALDQGFLPDIISTDMSVEKLHYGARVRSLPFVMSKFLSLGMELNDIVRKTTEVPAKLMGMEGKIGTLRPESCADVALFRLENRKVMHFDSNRVSFEGNHLLIPQMTILNGKIAFSQMDFNLPGEDVENIFAGVRMK